MSRYAQLEDAALVREALAGREEAYGELVRRFERPIYTLILRMVRDPGLAEDLSQEAFIKAFGALDRYDPQRKLASWLFKIAHNATIDHLRRKQLATVSLSASAEEGEADWSSNIEDEEAVTPEQAAERTALAEHLEQALGAMRPEYREVMVLRFEQGLQYNEISEVTGLALGTVKTFIHRARKELAETLREEGWNV